MGPRLERLVYASAATATTGSLLNVATILAQSQRNNDRDDLTGALVSHRDRYFQAVEGPGAALDALMRRLGTDPRHCGITVLERAPIPARLFSRWTMASVLITPALGAALDRLIGLDDRNPGVVIRIMLDALDSVPAHWCQQIGCGRP